MSAVRFTGLQAEFNESVHEEQLMQTQATSVVVVEVLVLVVVVVVGAAVVVVTTSTQLSFWSAVQPNVSFTQQDMLQFPNCVACVVQIKVFAPSPAAYKCVMFVLQLPNAQAKSKGLAVEVAIKVMFTVPPATTLEGEAAQLLPCIYGIKVVVVVAIVVVVVVVVAPSVQVM